MTKRMWALLAILAVAAGVPGGRRVDGRAAAR